MVNSSLYAAFERMWHHIIIKFNDYASTETFEGHVTNTENPHGVTKEQLELGNVDNTADTDKPISDATKAALDEIQEDLDAKADAEHTHWSDDIEWNFSTVVTIPNGGTGYDTIEDNTYTYPRYRASALLSYEPTLSPTQQLNGVIYWVYE